MSQVLSVQFPPPVAPPPPPNPAAKPPAVVAPPPGGSSVTPQALRNGTPETLPAGTAAPETPPAPPPKTALEQLLERPADPNDPIFGKEHKGLPAVDKVLANATDDVKKLVANLQASYTRERQADAKKAADAVASAKAARAELEREHSQYAALQTPEFQAHLKQLAEAAKDADPFTREGQEAIAEAKAAALFQRMMKPVEERLQVEAAKAHYEAYVANNPELKDPAIRKEVAAIARGNANLTLEQVHELWLGRRARAEAERLRSGKAADDAARAETLAMTGAGGLVGDQAGKPKFRDALEALAYRQARGEK